jgi:hypothetical protein
MYLRDIEICSVPLSLPGSKALQHLSGQVRASGTPALQSPGPSHGHAQAGCQCAVCLLHRDRRDPGGVLSHLYHGTEGQGAGQRPSPPSRCTPLQVVQPGANARGISLAPDPSARAFLIFPEVVMLHSLQPQHFVIPRYLQTPWQCPECKNRFTYGKGVMSLAHYRVTDTGEVKQGLTCFCSTTCLLRWEHPTMLGLMH